MFIVDSYSIAVVMCFVTMLCWGSWANTQKLASKQWAFQLFYWDYSLGVLLLALIFAFTLGSTGTEGRSFLADLGQAETSSIGSALLGGVIFNIANILLVAAIDIAGLAIAFPIGIGLALVLGVIVNYIYEPVGNAGWLFVGTALIVAAIILAAVAYRRLPGQTGKTSTKGYIISIGAGLLMGFFYRFVAGSMSTDFHQPQAGKLTPYTAVVIFSIGLLLSNFLWNTIVMYKPFAGKPVRYADYFHQGNPRLHLIGILGGMIWCLGMSFSIIASGSAGFAVSYGLGQGATMVAAFWGVFIWREFKGASVGTHRILTFMFLGYLAGLILIIVARLN
ncbi:MAG: Fatty acid elongase 3-ketoacyl-CoA synthase 1 [Planctomycetes bacterium ADurb.Bin412]|nr:MAG: Fatty acid elongase 3-ketoacyl-CoA synthase 1 [Planctomycetes bacterium ADurb.Bin412]